MSLEPLSFTTFYRHGAPQGDAVMAVEVTLSVEHGTAGAEMSLQARESGVDGDIVIESVRLEESNYAKDYRLPREAKEFWLWAYEGVDDEE
ncbi:MAG: hypothetical protein SX243_11980 [Acidobacteriota bacterium]|nr:hypothetical protein [Acidobacteriota bacterium]